MWCVLGLSDNEPEVYGPYESEEDAKAKLEELEADAEASEDDEDDVEGDDIDFIVAKMEK